MAKVLLYNREEMSRLSSVIVLFIVTCSAFTLSQSPRARVAWQPPSWSFLNELPKATVPKEIVATLWNVRQAQVTDPVWNTVAARLIRKTKASTLPVYFHGRNSVTFQLLGLINPKLRTLFLLQEFLQQREKNVQVCIGKAIPSELMANLENDEEATEYLRLRTYLLSYRGKKPFSLPTKMRSALPRKALEAIGPEVPSQYVINVVIVDLRQTDPAVLERYMSKEGYAGFRRFHRLD
jgi:hypothetical protein